MSAPQGTSTTFDIGNGKSVTIETGRLAKQAHGSVVLKSGETVILATVVSAFEAREGQDFFPLTVEYREKFSSAGKIPGGFFKREGRITDGEVLVSRLVDRAIRPLFPDDYKMDTQVIINLHSVGADEQPDALAALAASAALSISDIPFSGPISEVRVGRIDGNFVVNPGREEMTNSDMDIIVAADMNNVMMVEGEMKEVSEQDLADAISFGHEAIKKQCQAQLDLCEKLGGRKPFRDYEREAEDAEVESMVREKITEKVKQVAKSALDKNARKEQLSAIKDELMESLSEDAEDDYIDLVKKYYKKIEKETIRNVVIDDRVRLDGRQLDEIRPIWCEVDYLPAAHGSAVFTRGETQSLTTVTLGTKNDELLIETPQSKKYNKFILHYNFPPYSTGETKPLRGPGRREIGHGNLAFRALKPMIPTDDENPYTIRVVSDILESNGSSSMATVCAGTLALMDAGMKIKGAVSGIAMGLISRADGKYAVLSDILGDEDHLGDMDFKVTGTKNGITACQMDIKVDGLSYEVLSEALEQSKRGRLHILGEMMKAIDAPRADLKPHAPRIETIKIDKEFIGAVIGPGGKIIQEMQAETGTIINIEEDGNYGIVTIAGTGKEAIDAALQKVRNIVAVPEVGEVYDAEVKSIMPYGAFVEFLPGKQGLLHISEIEWRRLENVDSVLSVGETIQVKLLEVDQRSGKFRLSRKVLLPKPERSEKND